MCIQPLFIRILSVVIYMRVIIIMFRNIIYKSFQTNLYISDIYSDICILHIWKLSKIFNILFLQIIVLSAASIAIASDSSVATTTLTDNSNHKTQKRSFGFEYPLLGEEFSSNYDAPLRLDSLSSPWAR